MPSKLKPIKAWAVLKSAGKLTAIGNGHEFQYPIFYGRNRPSGALGFADRENWGTWSTSSIRRVVIVDAEEYEEMRLKSESKGAKR